MLGAAGCQGPARGLRHRQGAAAGPRRAAKAPLRAPSWAAAARRHINALPPPSGPAARSAPAPPHFKGPLVATACGLTLPMTGTTRGGRAGQLRGDHRGAAITGCAARNSDGDAARPGTAARPRPQRGGPPPRHTKDGAGAGEAAARPPRMRLPARQSAG